MDEDSSARRTGPGALLAADEDGAGEDARHRRTREKILAAATQVISRDYSATLADIAREADVGRTTLHRYFPTRAALHEALSDRALDRLDAVFDRIDFEQPLADALSQLVTACLPLGPEMVVVGNSAEQWESDWGGRWERYTAILASAVERAQARGEARAGVQTWWAAELVMLNLWGGWYVVNGGYVGPRAMPGLIMDTLLHGIAPAESPSSH
jgi:TetR/AcrR family transcriptional repressor of lfrA